MVSQELNKLYVDDAKFTRCHIYSADLPDRFSCLEKFSFEQQCEVLITLTLWVFFSILISKKIGIENLIIHYQVRITLLCKVEIFEIRINIMG